MEHWAADVLTSLDNKNLIAVEASTGMICWKAQSMRRKKTERRMSMQKRLPMTPMCG